MPSARTGRVDPHGRRWRYQIKVDGKKIRRSFGTREEAQAALAELLAELERDASGELARKLGRLTVEDVVRLYYERRKPSLELSTRARYENVMAVHIFPGIGRRAAKDVVATPLLMQDWLDTVPPGSARKALEVLGPAFRLAQDNGLVESNPVQKIRRPRRTARKRKKEIPTPAGVEKLIIAAYEEDVWWGYYVELTAMLGLRRAETAALRWEDFTFPREGEKRGLIRIRRAVGKRDGGIYIKPPKSGLERELLVAGSMFDGLEAFDGATGWLFPGRHVTPRKDPSILTRASTTGRVLVYLAQHNGVVTDPAGRAGAKARRAIGTNSATFSQASRWLEAQGYIERDVNARRTFRIALTPRGAVEAADLTTQDDFAMPVHPDTMGKRFARMAREIGVLTESGQPFSLHSLRHFRATHFYNRTKDWVQVAKYLGHTSPAITMELYANNVVSTTQEILADSAVDSFEPET